MTLRYGVLIIFKKASQLRHYPRYHSVVEISKTPLTQTPKGNEKIVSAGV